MGNFGLLICFLLTTIPGLSQELNRENIIQSLRGTEPLLKLIGQEIPEFKLATITGDSIHSNELSGTPSIINLWFVACPPCIEEMPLLNNIKKYYKDEVDFISITFNTDDEVHSLLENHPFNYLHLTNAKLYLSKIGIIAYPKTLILDKSNRIVRILDKPFIKKCSEKDPPNCRSKITSIINPLLDE